MLTHGPARKVTVFLNEDTRHGLEPLHEAILAFLLHHGVAGATASRALSGFGSRRVLHTSRIELLAEHLPIRIEFVESAAKVEELLPALYDLVTDGLVEVQDTFVVKATGSEASLARSRRIRQHASAKLMRVYLRESDRWEGKPLYQAIVERLLALDVAGATVHRGILGYGSRGRAGPTGAWRSRRDAPIMVAAVDAEAKLRSAVDALEGMLDGGLVVLSDVEIIRLVHPSPLAEGRDAQRPPG